jgi:two-component system OmpR family sensor kinase
MWSLPVLPPVVKQSRVVPVVAEIVPLAIVIGFALWQFERLDDIPLGAPARDVYAFLGLAAAGVATAAAVVARIAPESFGSTDRRLAGPLAFYGIAMIPASVLQSSSAPAPGVAVAKLVASSLFLALMVWALRAKKSTSMRWTTVVAGATLLTGLAGVVGPFLPAVVDSAAAALQTHRVVVASWWAVASVFVVTGALRRQPATWRIGIGLSVIAIAHLEHFTSQPGVWMPDLEFAALRLLGLVVVLLVLARAVRSASQREQNRSEQLAAAERAARQFAIDVAERDHEIRNVVSGLSGVGYLLRMGVDRLDGVDRATLGSAVQAELERLNELLGHASTADDGDTQILPLLTRLAALQRARGGQIELDVEEPGPGAQMPADELAQVMTNLLANCDRHAPGAPVRISADTQGDVVRITVTDQGPGPPPGELRPIVTARDCDPSAGGRGIGLRVCRRLLAAHNATLQLLPADGAHGCTVEVRVPTTLHATRAEKSSSIIARPA